MDDLGEGDQKQPKLDPETNIEKDIIAGNIPSTLDLDKTPKEIPVINLDPTTKGIAHMREGVRSNIALSLIILLFLIIIFSFIIFVYDDTSRAALKDLLTLFFAPIIGILGTVLGFYFGAEVKKESS